MRSHKNIIVRGLIEVSAPVTGSVFNFPKINTVPSAIIARLGLTEKCCLPFYRSLRARLIGTSLLLVHSFASSINCRVRRRNNGPLALIKCTEDSERSHLTDFIRSVALLGGSLLFLLVHAEVLSGAFGLSASAAASSGLFYYLILG